MAEPLLKTKRFKVTRRLAAGGMGEVLLADYKGSRKDQISSGIIVVKRNLQNQAHKATAAAMLREEGRIGMRLRHENLVQTFSVEDIGKDDPVLLMEYLAGRSMAQVLGAAKRARAPLPIDIALKILRDAACGLHFAHTLVDGNTGLGLVHRDVSPANIFVTFDGRVKVIDFGVAKAKDSEIRTSQGILKGKIGYMSPEHATGDKLDPRSDLWALGVVLWEMLLADRLFAGQNPAATLFQISNRNVEPPSSRRPDVPPAVDELCLRLLSRDRAYRTPSGAQLVRDIDTIGYCLEQANLGQFLCSRFPAEAETGMAEAARAARYTGKEPMPSGTGAGGINNDATLVGDGAFLIEAARSITADHVVHSTDAESANSVRAPVLQMIPLSAPPVQSAPLGALPQLDEGDDAATQQMDSALAQSLLSQNAQAPLGTLPQLDEGDDAATQQMDSALAQSLLSQASTADLLDELSQSPAGRPSLLPQKPISTGPIGPAIQYHSDDEDLATLAMSQPDFPTEMVAQPMFSPSSGMGSPSPPPVKSSFANAMHPVDPSQRAPQKATSAPTHEPVIRPAISPAQPYQPQRTPTGQRVAPRLPLGGYEAPTPTPMPTHQPQRTPTNAHQPQRTPTNAFPRQNLPKEPLIIPAMGPSIFTLVASVFGVLAIALGLGLGVFLQSSNEGKLPKLIRYVAAEGGDVIVARISDVPSSAKQKYSVDFVNPKLRAPDGRRVEVDSEKWLAALEKHKLLERARLPANIRAKVLSALPAALLALGLFCLFTGLPGFLKNEKLHLPLRVIGMTLSFALSVVILFVGIFTWHGLASLTEPAWVPQLKVSHSLAEGIPENNKPDAVNTP